MAQQRKSLTWGLFLLRFGLGGFLGLCAFDKIISPETSVSFFSHYFVSISPSIIMLVGGAELALSLLFILGMYKTWTYGLAFILQSLALAMMLEKLLSPFGKDILFVMLIPLLFAFFALFLMRNLDTKWTLTKKTGIFT